MFIDRKDDTNRVVVSGKRRVWDKKFGLSCKLSAMQRQKTKPLNPGNEEDEEECGRKWGRKVQGCREVCVFRTQRGSEGAESCSRRRR